MAEIMTPKELSRYLKMSVITIYKHAREGRIPAFRIGNSWRFDKRLIDELFFKGSGTRTSTVNSQKSVS